MFKAKSCTLIIISGSLGYAGLIVNITLFLLYSHGGKGPSSNTLVKSNNFTFAGNYKYETNNEKLILTQINDNNKYIYVYTEHEVIK